MLGIEPVLIKCKAKALLINYLSCPCFQIIFNTHQSHWHMIPQRCFNLHLPIHEWYDNRKNSSYNKETAYWEENIHIHHIRHRANIEDLWKQSQNSTTKIQMALFKWKEEISTSPKKIHRWPVGIWKIALFFFYWALASFFFLNLYEPMKDFPWVGGGMEEMSEVTLIRLM